LSKKINLSLILVLYLVFYTGCTNPQAESGSVAHDFMLLDLDGERFYLNEYQDQIIILNFWSIHCIPCQAEMPELEKINKLHQNQQVQIFGICTDPAERGYIETFLKGMNLTYPILVDSEGEVARLYRIKSVPVTIFIVNGIIRNRFEGYAARDSAKYRSIIKNLISQQKSQL